MKIYIYRSSRREGMYIYLDRQDGIDQLPEPVTRQMGAAEFAMAIELTEDRKLGQESSTTVLENIARDGFHLQMPRDIESQLQAAANQVSSDANGNKPD